MIRISLINRGFTRLLNFSITRLIVSVINKSDNFKSAWQPLKIVKTNEELLESSFF